MKKLLGIELTDEQFDDLMCQQSKGAELKLVDGQIVAVEHDMEKVKRQNAINRLKCELSTYDYIGVKIATGVATKEEYAKQIAYCETLRKQIRDLEKSITT